MWSSSVVIFYAVGRVSVAANSPTDIIPPMRSIIDLPETEIGRLDTLAQHLTRNGKEFPVDRPGIRIPYSL